MGSLGLLLALLELLELLYDLSLLGILVRPFGGPQAGGGVPLLALGNLLAGLGVRLVPLALLYGAPAVYAHAFSFFGSRKCSEHLGAVLLGPSYTHHRTALDTLFTETRRKGRSTSFALRGSRKQRHRHPVFAKVRFVRMAGYGEGGPRRVHDRRRRTDHQLPGGRGGPAIGVGSRRRREQTRLAVGGACPLSHAPRLRARPAGRRRHRRAAHRRRLLASVPRGVPGRVAGRLGDRTRRHGRCLTPRPQRAAPSALRTGTRVGLGCGRQHRPRPGVQPDDATHGPSRLRGVGGWLGQNPPGRGPAGVRAGAAALRRAPARAGGVDRRADTAGPTTGLPGGPAGRHPRPVRPIGPTRGIAGQAPPPGGADARRLGGARQDPTGPPCSRCGGTT